MVNDSKNYLYLTHFKDCVLNRGHSGFIRSEENEDATSSSFAKMIFQHFHPVITKFYVKKSTI